MIEKICAVLNLPSDDGSKRGGNKSLYNVYSTYYNVYSTYLPKGSKEYFIFRNDFIQQMNIYNHICGTCTIIHTTCTILYTQLEQSVILYYW